MPCFQVWKLHGVATVDMDRKDRGGVSKEVQLNETRGRSKSGLGRKKVSYWMERKNVSKGLQLNETNSYQEGICWLWKQVIGVWQ